MFWGPRGPALGGTGSGREVKKVSENCPQILPCGLLCSAPKIQQFGPNVLELDGRYRQRHRSHGERLASHLYFSAGVMGVGSEYTAYDNVWSSESGGVPETSLPVSASSGSSGSSTSRTKCVLAGLFVCRQGQSRIPVRSIPEYPEYSERTRNLGFHLTSHP